jgi:putative cell wall-binding protein
MITALLLGVTPAHGLQVSGNIMREGTVDTLAGAEVTVFYMGLGEAGFYDPIYADAFGWYTFSNHPADDDQMLRVWHPGYLTTRTNWFPTGPGVIKNVWLPTDPKSVERVAGNDRFSTATKIAWERYDGYDVHSGSLKVIIASGEDYAAADPLAAAGLCGAYDAPLFLVGRDHVPSSVKSAVKEVAKKTEHVEFVVVGGPVSVPDARIAELGQAAQEEGATHTNDRILSTGDRYDLAAAVAKRMQQVKGTPSWVLVANGADPNKFFDALALSTIAAEKHYPILLVSRDSEPSATSDARDSLGNPKIAIGGGPATVSTELEDQLDADNGYKLTERFWGDDRYETAIDVATQAKTKGWLTSDVIGIASKLPDALTGGAMVGRSRGCLVITQGDTLTPSTMAWIADQKNENDKFWIFGGEKSITPAVMSHIGFVLAF